MKVTLKIETEEIEKIKKAIIEWEDDSMINVGNKTSKAEYYTSWGLKDCPVGSLFLINSGGNIVWINEESSTVTYVGHRHGLESPTMTSLFFDFFTKNEGTENYTGWHELKPSLKAAAVIEYESWRKDRAWWECGLLSPEMEKVKNLCQKIGKEFSEDNKWTALDYRRASALSITI